jgi:hypothetical protein
MRLWPGKRKADMFEPFEGEEPPRMTYCIVPQDLAPKLYDSLRKHYENDPNIEVIIERRVAERRSGEERRKRDVGPPEGMEDRRRIRNEDGRRIGERRAQLIPVEPPADVPRKARKYLAHPGEDEEEEKGEAESQNGDDGAEESESEEREAL